MTVIISGTDGVSDVDGSAGTPAIRGTDANTGIFFPAADRVGVSTGGTQRVEVDASGNVGIGTTSPVAKLNVSVADGGNIVISNTNDDHTGGLAFGDTSSNSPGRISYDHFVNAMRFDTAGTERARITSGGNLLVGKTTTVLGTAGTNLASGINTMTVDASEVLLINRLTNDGVLIDFYQATVQEGTISVSGTTVSYNGGHLSRWAQMLTKPDLLKGTVMSNLDEMNVYVDADGNPVENEQLNKVKVSDVEGDANVAGVFVNWTYDDAHQVDEINMAMTGDMIIRIAQGVTVARGDLLMSAGDGTAMPQGDDIVRSKTVAKVTSTHVTCTYDDGSYCVPCVLMAC